ncbi:hypothetical protein GCM10022234_36450 [Aeromicrobium panaciterrae]|uniref:acyl carrier protein n=1 Tax=Aeromicrobium panaciterrae TaxID=363861 RepID=UPI0031DF0261
MPAPHDVRTQIADILAAVQGVEPDAVQPESRLKELGVDSITIVEVGEELGRRFNVYLSDDTIDGFVTVNDAINAVVHHDGSTAGTGSPAVPAAFAPPPPPAQPSDSAVTRMRTHEPERVRLDDEKVRTAGRYAIWMAIIGAGLGVLVGLGGAAVIGATGLGPANLPPLSVSTTDAPTTATTTSPTPTPTDSSNPEPTLRASKLQVEPGERFTLEGVFPGLGTGATLQVQVRDPGGDWDDFPVDTKTKGDGAYSTQIYTSRTGKRDFRMFHEESSKASPTVTVEIG